MFLRVEFDFVDLDLICKVTGGLQYEKISIKLIYLLNLLLDSHQATTAIPLGQSKELSMFWRPCPFFKVIVLYVAYLLNQ